MIFDLTSISTLPKTSAHLTVSKAGECQDSHGMVCVAGAIMKE